MSGSKWTCRCAGTIADVKGYQCSFCAELCDREIPARCPNCGDALDGKACRECPAAELDVIGSISDGKAQFGAKYDVKLVEPTLPYPGELLPRRDA